MPEQNIEHEHTKDVICPHCGHNNGRDDVDFRKEEFSAWCAQCGEMFRCSITTRVRFTTRKDA